MTWWWRVVTAVWEEREFHGEARPAFGAPASPAQVVGNTEAGTRACWAWGPCEVSALHSSGQTPKILFLDEGKKQTALEHTAGGPEASGSRRTRLRWLPQCQRPRHRADASKDTEWKQRRPGFPISSTTASNTMSCTSQRPPGTGDRAERTEPSRTSSPMEKPTGKERRELQIRREGQRLSKNYGQGDEDSTEKFGRGLEDIFSRQNYYKY